MVDLVDPEEEARSRPARRTALLRLLAAVVVGAVALAVVAAVAYVVLDVEGDDVDDGATVLALPLVGDAVGEILDDDTPVWVVHDADGEVRVLRARDAVEEEVPTQVWAVNYCPASGTFESYWGSRFDRTGRLLGGPADSGLGVYEVEVRDDEVVVGDLVSEDAGRTDSSEGGSSSDAVCDGEGPAVYHPLWEPL